MNDILLAIDDEHAFLEIIQKVGRSAGFAATVTTDPAHFRTALIAEPPSVVLLDLQMPQCDGVELLRTLAEAGCRARVILMSGFDARVLTLARDVGRDLGLDMGEPLQKPLRPADLRQVLLKIRGTSFEPDAEGLRAAIDANQLELFYHPLVTLSTGQTIGFEALVRWRHPEFGILTPDLFVPLAEREGLIDLLTNRVLELATGQLAAWMQLGIELFVSVNISATNIAANLPDKLTELCTRHQIPPRLLRLELTEAAAMTNAKLMLEILTRIRLKGFQLAIDDFGTGYSSLVQLHRLPFTELKIDQSFVREMASSEEANLIIGAMVGLGRSLSLDLIAEGIETKDLADRLLAMGCETGQGYFYSRPMSADDVPGWLTRQLPHEGAIG